MPSSSRDNSTQDSSADLLATQNRELLQVSRATSQEKMKDGNQPQEKVCSGLMQGLAAGAP